MDMDYKTTDQALDNAVANKKSIKNSILYSYHRRHGAIFNSCSLNASGWPGDQSLMHY